MLALVGLLIPRFVVVSLSLQLGGLVGSTGVLSIYMKEWEGWEEQEGEK